MIDNLVDQLKRDEGEVLHAYLDSKGILTAGVGHNLEAHCIPLILGTPITQETCDSWLQQDIKTASDELSKYIPWTEDLDPIRKAVLQNMSFNMGIGKLLVFHHFLAALQDRNYDLAASEMLNSLWAKQVGARASRLSQQIKTGLWV